MSDFVLLRALDALGRLEIARPGERFTTAQVAIEAGATNYTAGAWTRPWRDALYVCMLAGLVGRPTGRPHRWSLTPSGRECCDRQTLREEVA